IGVAQAASLAFSPAAQSRSSSACRRMSRREESRQPRLKTTVRAERMNEAKSGALRIAVLPGDGIGPEVTAESVRVLEAVGRRFGHRFEFEYDDVGGASIDKHGTALRKETLALAKRCRAVLFGAVGGPKWDDPTAPVRPEDAILGLRKGLGLFANLRPT